MGVVLHWFLPTNGDSRTDLSLGNAVGMAGSRVTRGRRRARPGHRLHRPDRPVRGAARLHRRADPDQLMVRGRLDHDRWRSPRSPSGSAFLVAFRPGLMSPTLAAHMAATYQRISGGAAAAERGDRRRRRGAAAVRRPPGQDRAIRAGRRIPAHGPRAVDRRAGQLHRRALRHPRRPDHHRARLAGHLPGRLVAAGPRRGGQVRRRVPDLGRAAGRGRGEARPVRSGPRRPAGSCATASGCT